ncbi:MAG: GDSL-type esterase/lipase family protein, partial [Planctomycetes bacterium]|nr:GDSL-type esterase/lipase family protein [Planctomycetota bacterium]
GPPAPPPYAGGMSNPALQPVPGFEKDFYDWPARHAAKVAAARARRWPLLLVGDSITHIFEGDPGWGQSGGAPLWGPAFRGQALNLGCGYDRTQNVLWRLADGELDGQRPDCAVVMIGTNNLGSNGSVPACTPAQTAEGVEAVCELVRGRGQAAQVLLMAILPRGGAADPLRAAVAETNRLLARLPSGRPWLRLLDIGGAFLDPDGGIPRHLMADGVHPTTDGYRLWMAALAGAGVLPG